MIFKSDGSANGTVPAVNDAAIRQLSNPHSLTSINGSLYFIDRDITTVNSFLPWKIVGDAPQRISMISNLPNNPSFSASSLYNANGNIYFVVRDRLGAELWKVDQTQNTASLVRDINPGVRDANPGHLQMWVTPLFHCE